MALYLPTIPSILAERPRWRSEPSSLGPRSERSEEGDSFIEAHENLLIAAGAVVAVGLLCCLFRRPIGKWIATLKSPVVPPPTATPLPSTLSSSTLIPPPTAAIPIAPKIIATTNPTIVTNDFWQSKCVEVSRAGDLLCDESFEFIDRQGQVRYVVAECLDGAMKLRVGSMGHIDMLQGKLGEKVVGAGYLRLDPVHAVLSIDGQSTTWGTDLQRVWIDPKSITKSAENSGLIRIKEFLSRLFGDEIKEIRILGQF